MALAIIYRSNKNYYLLNTILIYYGVDFSKSITINIY